MTDDIDFFIKKNRINHSWVALWARLSSTLNTIPYRFLNYMLISINMACIYVVCTKYGG